MAFALLALVLLTAGSRADLGWDLETRILDTVQNVADFVANQSIPLIDAYFGITLAEAQMRPLLDWVRSQGAENCPIGKLIAETEVKLGKVLQASEEKRDTDDLLWMFINPELWEVSGPRRNFPLRILESNFQVNKTSENEIIEFAMQGTPKEKESDACIRGLIHICTVSNGCWLAQTSINPPPHGYPLTHRLLFLQTARQMNCESSQAFANISISAAIRNLCEKILAESSFIETLDYPEWFHDLFTEQITLCGMEGFREFVSREWTEKILSWKMPSGCYTSPWGRNRMDIFVDDCSMHTTVLAAAALSTALRNMLEDTIIYNCTKI